jgi:peptide/nickel transport system substrate-binding protein
VRPLRALSSLVVLTLIVSACSGSSSPSPAASSAASGPAASSGQSTTPTAAGPSGKLTWAYSFGPVANWATESNDAFILQQASIAETLTKSDFDQSLKPMLAVSWKQVDPTTWDFSLRPGVKFQNGDPLTADAVVGALNHVLDAKVPARAFNKDIFASVAATDPMTVRVTTKAPDIFVPDRMANDASIILAPSAYSASGVNPVGTGTGPYTMTAQNLPQSVSLKANATYWGDAPKIADVEMQFTPDGQTRATELQAGSVQLADDIPIASIPTLKSAQGVTVVTGALQRVVTLHLNESRAPFNNIKVRQAVQAAIDVTAISTQVLEGGATPAADPFAPTDPWAPQGAKPVAQNIDQAKQLLQSAGVDPSTLHLSIWAYTERPELALVATAIQSMLQQIGINAEIRTAQYNSLYDDLIAGKFDMVIASRGYTFDVNDPGNYFQTDWTCAGTYNLSHHCDPAFDAAVTSATAITDQTQRYSAYATLATQLQTDADSVYLYNEEAVEGVSSSVQGYRIHPQTLYVLTTDVSVSP